MITETYDNKTNAIITPQRVADAPKVDACIQTFSWKIEEFVLANFDCKKITSIWSVTGETPVYCIEYKGKRFAFFKTYVGAPASAANLED
ncbi:MAG: phosphorylase, partial [Lachnospiraceae bacterium]|nr:phosphorylase [Lachnospiraceae bacterium]